MGATKRSNGSAYSWAASAVVVALLATAIALRLLVQACQQRIGADDSVSSPLPPTQDNSYSEPGTASNEFPEADAQETAEPAPEPIIVRLSLGWSVRLSSVLQEAGLDEGQARRWSDRFQQVARTRVLAAGHLLSLYKDPETGDLRGFRYDLDDHTAVVEQDYGDGVVLVGERPIQYVVRPVSIAFAVRDSFNREVDRRRIPKPIIESLHDAFSSRHPLDQLPPGSALKLIYNEEVSRDGTHRMVGDLQAAQVRIGGRTLHAFAFRDEHGRAHLYDERGNPLGAQGLRFPLPFEYISSGFTAARYHPILHRYRPHVGVDLVAQYGTPVKAIADGRVESSDWAGELGKCVRIEHDREMVSIYGHLSRISPVAKSGSYVRVGQVIGWVGSSGLSTGPHLHFALLREGRYVNPLSEKLGANHGVSPRLRALFDQIKQRYQFLLARLPDLGGHRVFAGQRKPAISRFGDLYHVELKTRLPTGRRISRRPRTFSVDLNGGGL